MLFISYKGLKEGYKYTVSGLERSCKISYKISENHLKPSNHTDQRVATTNSYKSYKKL